MSEALTGENRAFIEMMYDRWTVAPGSVPDEWRSWFDGPVETAAPTDTTPSALGTVKLFSGLSGEDLVAITERATMVALSDGTALFAQGDPGGDLYVVTRGSLVIRQSGRVIAELGEGEVVGELSLLEGRDRSADAIARGDTRVLRLDGAEFTTLLHERPSLSRAMLGLLAGRVRRSTANQERVDMLIRAYRVRGHRLASLDPLGRQRASRQDLPALSIEHYGLTEAHLETHFSTRSMGGRRLKTLREIVGHLEAAYCGHIGVQYMHIDDLQVQRWIQERMEDISARRALTRDDQVRILTRLTSAEIFEQFLHRKFQGAKRFSLEGGESLLPLLDLAIEEAGRYGVQDIVIGMAHRGRLNVMANVMGKSPAQIFREFADVDADRFEGRGDVKYHLGHSSDWTTAQGTDVHLTLCFNPSHLECVGPVVQGRTRAKQHRLGDAAGGRVMPLVIHGDSAIAGEGVNQELFNMSELEGYAVGGTVHVVLNNQIGFTTTPDRARSTQYCTEVARMLQVPIFHVNGEHPEAVTHTIQLAMAFRERYRKDVVIDMYCYRRYGHNEGDEPTFTQPLMYEAIRKRGSVRDAYVENLLSLGGITEQEAEQIAVEQRQILEGELAQARSQDYEYATASAGEGLWSGYVGGAVADCPDEPTRVARDRLSALLQGLVETPPSFTPHPKIKRLLRARGAMAAGERPLDWGAAESLAFATLVAEGVHVRMTGQDAGRGTFSHRHSVLRDVGTAETWIPIDHAGPGHFEVHDSPLTETAVLGFEYGYSLDYPDGLVLWEAQFGDFVNVAQVIIDQFISSAEDKWQRLSGMVMLLPHGFEGQGPEHSSARLERFLQLCAEDNMYVCNLTTPAQLFHCLRRQVVRPLRKPLIVMSPKSLLRHPAAVSILDELAEGAFQPVIPDPEPLPPSDVRRIVLTSGKLYYELAARRAEDERTDVALLRLEQYHPLDRAALAAALERYPADVGVLWAQEEPRNMGAWPFLLLQVGADLCGRPLTCATRPASASPATGSAASHRREQATLIDRVFRLGSE